MSETLRSALVSLIQYTFDVYLFVLAIRLILAWVGAEYTHRFTQVIVKLTSFLVKPMRKIIPDFRKLETATVVLILIIECIKFSMIAGLSFGFPNPVGLIIIAFGDGIQLILQTFTYAILFQAIMSWIQPGTSFNSLLYQFTSPIMRPLSRIIPLVGGIDITPIPAILLLQLLSIVLAKPLVAVGLGVAFG